MVYDAVVMELKVVSVNRLKWSTPWDCAKVRKRNVSKDAA